MFKSTHIHHIFSFFPSLHGVASSTDSPGSYTCYTSYNRFFVFVAVLLFVFLFVFIVYRALSSCDSDMKDSVYPRNVLSFPAFEFI